MATRAQIRFAERKKGQSFSKHPDAIQCQFYAHWDGYPESRGVEIAESILNGRKLDGWEIDYMDTERDNLEYIYYIWQSDGKPLTISIMEVLPFRDQIGKCIFVGTPQELLQEYRVCAN